MSLRARMTRVFEWRVWHLYLMAGIASLILLGLGAGVVVGSLYLRSQSKQETRANARINAAQSRALENLRRIQALERPPSDRQLAAAASNALRACVADPACRRALRGSIRGARLRPSDLPDTSDNSSSGSSPSGTGSSPSGGSSNGSDGSGTTTQPRRPSVTPQPSRPQAPAAPRRPAPPASSTPTRPPAAPPRQPTPSNPLPTPPTPTVSTPVPVPPVVPPVTVPAPVQVCTPVVQVNCRNARGRVVSSAGPEVDPASGSGRGSEDDQLCDRLKLPCDEAGNPVFPAGLIRLP